MIEIGTRSSSAARPATGTSTRRISSVAYAVDEMASEANTVSAVGRPSLVWCSSDEAIGGPTTSRFSAEYIKPSSRCVARSLPGPRLSPTSGS